MESSSAATIAAVINPFAKANQQVLGDRMMGIEPTLLAWETDNLGSVGDIAQMLAFGPLPSVRDSRIQVSSGVNRAN